MHATWRRRIQNFPSNTDGDDQFPEVDDGTKRLFWARSTPIDEARVADKELGVASTAVTAPGMLLVRPIADSAGTHRCLTSTHLRQGSQVGIRLSRINVSFLIWTRDMSSEINLIEFIVQYFLFLYDQILSRVGGYIRVVHKLLSEFFFPTFICLKDHTFRTGQNLTSPFPQFNEFFLSQWFLQSL